VAQQEINGEMLPDAPVGLFYTWWRGDALPEIATPPKLTVELDPDGDNLRQLTGLADDELRQRFERGNRAVIGWMDGEAAASGWSCAGRVEIGELGLDFQVPPDNRYLWDFVTLPEWRGRRIYPALLRAFIDREPGVERFWVGHDLDNVASSRGILKAGFQTVGAVYAVEGVGPVYVTGGSAPERARAAAELLGIPLIERDG